MKFTNAYTGNAVCAPSRCVLMTGLHAGHAWVRDNKSVGVEGQTAIPASSPTIPKLLQAAGYATGAMGKWGLGGPGTEGDPHRQGFDLFYGFNCQSHAHNHYPTYLWRNDKREGLSNDGTLSGGLGGDRLFGGEQEDVLNGNGVVGDDLQCDGGTGANTIVNC